MTDLDPRTIAEAISALAHPVVLEAWRYLDRWHALSIAGVPAADVRRVLATTYCPEGCKPVTLQQTDAMGLVRSVHTQTLAMHGGVGAGKTYAAAVWALDRLDAGQTTKFVELVEWARLSTHAADGIRGPGPRQLELDRAARAPGLVLDDVGAGWTKGDAAKEQWEGVIMSRMSRDLPTVIISNVDAKDIGDWLGARVISRLGMGGGIVEVLGDDLRKGEPEPHDADGHGPRWHRATALVSMFGCRGVSEDRLVVGADLDNRVRSHAHDVAPEPMDKDGLNEHRRKAALAECRAAMELAGLKSRWSDVEAKAKGVTADLDVQDQRMAALQKAIKVKTMADVQRRSYATRDVLQGMQARKRGEPGPWTNGDDLPGAPGWTEGRGGREKLKRLGFGVEESTISGYLTKRKRYPEHVKPGQDPWTIIGTADTEAEAWRLAARLCG